MQTLKDIFVPYEIAQKLKEIGFDEPCLFYYSWKDKIHCLIPNRTEQTRIISIIEIDKHNANESEDPFCSAPTYEQVFKWFREKEIESSLVVINEIMWDDYDFGYGYHIVDFIDRTVGKDYGFIEHFETYEEAREQLILKLIEIYEKGK